MPHKRAKRSVRDAKTKSLGQDNAPTAADSADSGLSKNMMRILNAEKFREKHRQKQQQKKKQAEESGEAAPSAASSSSASASRQLPDGKKLTIREGESLKAFSRRAEEALRGDINSAMRSASKKSSAEEQELPHHVKKRKRKEEAQRAAEDAVPKIKHQPVDQRIAEKRAKQAQKNGALPQSEGGDGVEEFQDAPRLKLNDVAEAPPSLDKFVSKKNKGAGGKGAGRVGLSLGQQEALQQQRQTAIQRYRELKQSKLSGIEKEKEQSKGKPAEAEESE